VSYIIISSHIQVGDNAEVMYFAASSKEERDEWMEAFRKG